MKEEDGTSSSKRNLLRITNYLTEGVVKRKPAIASCK